MGGIGGLNLGGLGKNQEQQNDLQYSMQIGNTNMQELPPKLRRGEDLNAQREDF